MKQEIKPIEITETAMSLIECVVHEQNLSDVYDVLDAVCELMERLYGDAMERRLRRMHISTTSEIIRTIEIYFIIKSDFPDFTFRKFNVNRKKASVCNHENMQRKKVGNILEKGGSSLE